MNIIWRVNPFHSLFIILLDMFILSLLARFDSTLIDISTNSLTASKLMKFIDRFEFKPLRRDYANMSNFYKNNIAGLPFSESNGGACFHILKDLLKLQILLRTAKQVFLHICKRLN